MNILPKSIFCFIVVATFILLSAFFGIAHYETYHTTHGKIELFFNLKIQPIKAKLRNASSIIYLKDEIKGDSIFFSFEPKHFDFDNALAETHIKDKYLEHQKYPKITFKGKFLSKIDYKNPKNQQLKVKGLLQMKKVTREEEIPVNIVLHEKDIKMHTEFVLEASNYGILDEEHRFKDGKDNINIKLDATYKIKMH